MFIYNLTYYTFKKAQIVLKNTRYKKMKQEKQTIKESTQLILQLSEDYKTETDPNEKDETFQLMLIELNKLHCLIREIQ